MSTFSLARSFIIAETASVSQFKVTSKCHHFKCVFTQITTFTLERDFLAGNTAFLSWLDISSKNRLPQSVSTEVTWLGVVKAFNSSQNFVSESIQGLKKNHHFRSVLTKITSFSLVRDILAVQTVLGYIRNGALDPNCKSRRCGIKLHSNGPLRRLHHSKFRKLEHLTNKSTKLTKRRWETGKHKFIQKANIVIRRGCFKCNGRLHSN